ncbi:MAG: hypothetical protein R3316_06290 [Rhodovibrionaceae bacterium]|nr:hypothetical protein [Rhodovibrionaceae bacterium]
MFKTKVFDALGTVDPTIPGLSARDLSHHAIDHADRSEAHGSAERHRAHMMRHDLMRMDRELLRDIGLERDAA